MSFTEQIQTPPAGTTIRQDGDIETKLETGKSGSVTMYTLGPTPPEDVLKAAGLDPARWAIRSAQTGQWDGLVKSKQKDGTEEVAIARLHKTSIKVAPTAPDWLLNGLDLIHERIKKYSPDYSRWSAERDRVDEGQGVLGVLGLFDSHIGQYAHRGETGENNDLAIIAARYRGVIDRIVRKGQREGVTEWLFPVGQDFLHIDNPKNETTRGTGQDVDTRFAKVVDVGFDCLRHATEQLLKVAPVRLVYSAGNHDRTVSYHLTRELAAWFRTAEDVETDYAWIKRKYLLWGENLIGLAHGDSEPYARLVQEMPVVCPDWWAESKYRAYFTGHFHHKKRRAPFEIEDRQGIVFHQVASLSGRDCYHYENVYHSNRAGELFCLAHDASEQGNWTLCA